MRKTDFIRILAFSLFLVMLFSVRGYAEITVSDSWELPTDPTIYIPNKYYRFNVTVCDSGGYSNIDTVLFEWNNEPNITVTDSFNTTENCSIFNTTMTDLAANESGWNYKWYANNTGSENATLDDNYTINKATPDSIVIKLYIDNVTDDKTITYPEIAEIRGNTTISGADDLNFNLSRDGTLLGSGNTTNQTVDSTQLGNATYNFIYNTTGGANWTSGSVSRTLYVNKGTLPIHLYLDGTEGNRIDGNSYDFNDIANFSVLLNTTDVPYMLGDNTTYLYSNFTYWDVQNSNNSTFFNYTLNLNHSGLFNLTAYWSGDTNYSSNSTTFLFGVTPYCINKIEYPASDTTYSQGENYSFEIECIGNIKNVSFEWVDSIYLANNTSNIFYYNLTDLTAKPSGYSYKWHATDINDNTFNSTQYTYIINKTPVNLTLTCSDTDWSVSSGSSVDITCQASEPINVRIRADFVDADEGTSPIITPLTNLLDNTYVECLIANSNYSASPKTHWITVTTTGGTGSTGGGGDDYAPSGSFLIKDLTSSLSVEAGKSKSTSFKLSNTLSNNLVDVNISVSKISSSWYRLSKSSISNLKRDVPETITITFNIPEDAEVKDYDVTVRATGRIIGTTTKRTTSKTMKLKVTTPKPTPAPTSQEPEEELEEATIETTAEENITANETTIGPTGLAATFEYLKNNLVIVVAIGACLLIFILRNNITTTLMKAGGRKVPKKTKPKTKEAKPSRLKSLSKYKLAINLRRGRGRKAKIPEKEPKEIKRPEVLEREIKRDIKELQQVLEAEKKIEKKKKKIDLENN